VTIHVELQATIWEPLVELVPFLQEQRRRLSTEQADLRKALNQSIVFHAACIVEGALEQSQRRLLATRVAYLRQARITEMPDSGYFNRFVLDIEDDLKKRISRTTGLQEHLRMIDLLTGSSLSGGEFNNSTRETAAVLFQFRNVLAHGRQINATSSSGPATEGEWLRSFSGGYRKVEDYLIKRGMADLRVLRDPDANNAEDAIAELFEDSVADHFWAGALNLFAEISQALDASPELRLVFDEAVSLLLPAGSGT